jgi:hypothetical protein
MRAIGSGADRGGHPEPMPYHPMPYCAGRTPAPGSSIDEVHQQAMSQIIWRFTLLMQKMPQTTP